MDVVLSEDESQRRKIYVLERFSYYFCRVQLQEIRMATDFSIFTEVPLLVFYPKYPCTIGNLIKVPLQIFTLLPLNSREFDQSPTFSNNYMIMIYKALTYYMMGVYMCCLPLPSFDCLSKHIDKCLYYT